MHYYFFLPSARIFVIKSYSARQNVSLCLTIMTYKLYRLLGGEGQSAKEHDEEQRYDLRYTCLQLPVHVDDVA